MSRPGPPRRTEDEGRAPVAHATKPDGGERSSAVVMRSLQGTAGNAAVARAIGQARVQQAVVQPVVQTVVQRKFPGRTRPTGITRTIRPRIRNGPCTAR